MNSPLEHYEQILFVDWFRAAYPDMSMSLHAVPNQFTGRSKEIQKRVREGLSKGYPDLLLDIPKGVFHGLRIEMKRIDGVPSQVNPSQRQWLNRLNENGYYATVAWGGDHAIAIAKAYLSETLPTRAPHWHVTA